MQTMKMVPGWADDLLHKQVERGILEMGFIKRFTKTSTREGSTHESASSFADVSQDELERHLDVARYGSFLLTDAVRPSFNLDVIPSAGYRKENYTDKETGAQIPVIIASQTRERLMDLFVDLLDPMGDEVDVVLETSHHMHGNEHQDMYREAIDLPVLKSTLFDFEEMITNDGCMGVAVLNPRIPLEVQFDEHKLIIMYGHDVERFEGILQDYGVPERDEIRFITEAEHVHSSTEEYVDQFEQLKFRLGIDDE